MKLVLAFSIMLAACGSRGGEPAVAAMPKSHQDFTATAQFNGPRMVPPEAFLRAYLEWFGERDPQAVFKAARGFNLFDHWLDYLAALGLPDYKLDFPRATQSNTMMLATFGRLGEALCIKAVERDLRAGRGRVPMENRRIYAFEERPIATLDEFAAPFDVLHRTFLGYPASLAEPGRIPRFFELYQRISSRHPTNSILSAEQTAWAAICSALVIHPETGLY